jgi:uncharacterized protein YfcZ (UPF0381/DUF406 family)
MVRAGTRVTLGVLVGALMAAGSIGVAGAATPKTPALTKAEFITQGDAICAAGNQQEDALQASVIGASKNPTKAQLNTFAKGIAKIILDEQAELSKLTPPSADKAKIKKLLAELKKEAKALAAKPSLISSGQGLQKAAKQAQAYGFKVCGSTSD